MNFVLGFAPFLAFALLAHMVGSAAGLLAGAAVSAALLLRDVLRGQDPKTLELGTMLLFGALSLYNLVAAPTWSLMGVRLVVDTGLLLIVLGSLLAGKPFTLQYAKESTPPEHWNTSAFLQANKRITGVWAIAFALLVAADLVLLYLPQVSAHIGIAVTIAALAWAMHRTRRLTIERSAKDKINATF